MRINVITFPGSNCDHDAYHIFEVRGHQVDFVWHKDEELKSPDLVIVPGGFSYGDYLRCGAIAKVSPIMQAVKVFANGGGHVMGICNGFQILTEAGLLPGALMMNESLRFICKHQFITAVNGDSAFTNGIKAGTALDIPIAHKEGNYFIDEDGLKELKANNQIAFKYCDENGVIDSKFNPNGSIDNIAGVLNREKNVLGMMPHPERAGEDVVVSQDGKAIFEAIERFFS
ncbi:MAG: phosphoribosylformylglycinamidine synthase I [Candidatus Cloacimonetes bacterium 4572_65]|nr:MAG: phosphoribosylformylglycinamidine synthase I [Candidatus Cloacimonetes bacterium 4572_65]